MVSFVSPFLGVKVSNLRCDLSHSDELRPMHVVMVDSFISAEI